jgi:hypothetical protein
MMMRWVGTPGYNFLVYFGAPSVIIVQRSGGPDDPEEKQSWVNLFEQTMNDLSRFHRIIGENRRQISDEWSYDPIKANYTQFWCNKKYGFQSLYDIYTINEEKKDHEEKEPPSNDDMEEVEGAEEDVKMDEEYLSYSDERIPVLQICHCKEQEPSKFLPVCTVVQRSNRTHKRILDWYKKAYGNKYEYPRPSISAEVIRITDLTIEHFQAVKKARTAASRYALLLCLPALERQRIDKRKAIASHWIQYFVNKGESTLTIKEKLKLEKHRKAYEKLQKDENNVGGLEWILRNEKSIKLRWAGVELSCLWTKPYSSFKEICKKRIFFYKRLIKSLVDDLKADEEAKSIFDIELKDFQKDIKDLYEEDDGSDDQNEEKKDENMDEEKAKSEGGIPNGRYIRHSRIIVVLLIKLRRWKYWQDEKPKPTEIPLFLSYEHGAKCNKQISLEKEEVNPPPNYS